MTMPNEFTIHLPPQSCGDIGDSLPQPVINLINAMAEFGYWPVDFGEDDGKSVELWFAFDPQAAAEQADLFIKSAAKGTL